MSTNLKSRKLALPPHLTPAVFSSTRHPVLPKSGWECFVIEVGRGWIALAIFWGVLFTVLGIASFVIIGPLVGALAILVGAGLALLALQTGPIDPNIALQTGGHAILVTAEYWSGGTVLFGRYTVETLSGRPPVKVEGDLASGWAQVVVGHEWIGQVHIRHWGQCGAQAFDVSNSTDFIGESFGWHNRTVKFRHPC